MNIFMDFFKNMTDEEWEKFGVHVLTQVGFSPITLPAYGADGGMDFLVEKNKVKYLVSCKHYISSGKRVGVSNESNIIDRLIQHNVNGFIGFYSTGITTKLQDRLNQICENTHYHYLIFEPQHIAKIVQSMDTKVLQSFGLYPNKYYWNVTQSNYQPLKCIVCGKDILTDENIPKSLAGVEECENGTYGFVYGCKRCLFHTNLYLNQFIEIEQSLHLKWLQEWERMIDQWIEKNNWELKNDFYKMRYFLLTEFVKGNYPKLMGHGME